MEKKPNELEVEFVKRKPILTGTQCKRLGGLVTILMNQQPLDDVVTSLKDLKLVVERDNCLLVNEFGIQEARRLLKITGIRLEIKKRGLLVLVLEK